MATVEALQELRSDVMKEFQKVATLQEDHRAKVQEHQRWKVDNENRILRQDSQQSTLGSAVSDLVARIEKLEKSSVGQLPDAARGKDKWQLTRLKYMDPAEFAGREEEWLKWKEATEDYVDAVHPGMKQALSLAALHMSSHKRRIGSR